jgi:polar amino acid transport system substrate-binding protein
VATSPKRVKRYKWRIIISLIFLAFSAYTSVRGVYIWYKNRPPTKEEAFPRGELVVGVDASFPPFAVDNGETLYGLDIDLGNAIAEEIDIPIRFINMGFDGLYDSLIDAQVDIVISALLVNPARTRDVRYTQPYFDNGLVLVNDDMPELVAMSDLPTHSVALEYGSIAHSEANFWLQRLDPFEVLPYELPLYALDAIRLNEANSALVDTTTYWLYRAEHLDWESESHRVNHAFYAIAVRYDREGMYNWVNAVLGRLIRRGEIEMIIERWFTNS